MYDTIIEQCPICNEYLEFQSKSGECLLQEFTLQSCPDDILANANRHSPITCDCGNSYRVDIEARKLIKL